MQSALIIVAQHLHPSSAGLEVKSLFRDQLAFTGTELADRAEQPLLQLDLHAGFEVLHVCARRQAAGNVQPILFGEIHKAVAAVNQGIGCKREPNRGWAFNPVPEKAGWCNPDHGERLAIESKSRTHYAGVLSVFLLPEAIAYNHCWFGTLAIIGWRQQASGVSPDTEHGEIIPRNVFAALWFGRLIASGAAHS